MKDNDRLRDIWALLAYSLRALNMVRQENQFVGSVQTLFDKVYRRWANHFGDGACTYYIHHFSHMQHYYDLLGPLANWSALPYESSYSRLRNMNISTRDPCKQILQEMYEDYELREHPR